MNKDIFIEGFSKDKGFIKKLGISVKDINETEATFYIKLKDYHLNPVGIAHGGVLYSLADTTMGAIPFYNKNQCVTVNATINYLRACDTKTVYCTAKEVKKGKNLSFYEAKLTNEEGIVLATAIGTYMNIDNK